MSVNALVSCSGRTWSSNWCGHQTFFEVVHVTVWWETFFLLAFLGRVPNSSNFTSRATTLAYLTPLLERRRTFRTGPVHPLPDLLECTKRAASDRLWLRVRTIPTIIVSGGFVGFVWITRAFLAPVVFAIGAYFLCAKVCLASVASAVDSLSDLLANQILATSATRKSKERLLSSASNRLNFALIAMLLFFFAFVLLILLRRETRA